MIWVWVKPFRLSKQDILFRSGSIKKVLIVCPLSLIATWEFEISKWAKHLSISRVSSEGSSTTKMVESTDRITHTYM